MRAGKGETNKGERREGERERESGQSVYRYETSVVRNSSMRPERHQRIFCVLICNYSCALVFRIAVRRNARLASASELSLINPSAQ